MNRQAFYNGVKAYFSRPDAEFAMADEKCVYRGKSDETGNDIACGIGCMIPPALYHPDFECNAIYSVLTGSPSSMQVMEKGEKARTLFLEKGTALAEHFDADTREDRDFLTRIQEAHDDNASTGDLYRMLDDLKEVAAHYNLIP